MSLKNQISILERFLKDHVALQITEINIIYKFIEIENTHFKL